jgi:transcriptional regulator with XRE-family HTH domain
MFHTNLQAAMRRKQLTTAGLLAELERYGLCISAQAVQLWVDGVRMPRARHLSAIAAVLGMSVDSLLPKAHKVSDPSPA